MKKASFQRFIGLGICIKLFVLFPSNIFPWAETICPEIYFSISCITISNFLYDERKYLLGEVDKPQKVSFLSNSPATVIFNMFLLMCGAFGTVSSVLVIVGINKDQREFLVPWIIDMLFNILVETSYFLYLIIFEQLKFQLLTATIFTIDFFIMCLNIYCLTCVISQYQELKAGRGRKELLICTNNVTQYVPPSQTRLNSVRTVKGKNLYSPSIMYATNCTVIPEESHVNASSNVIRKSPFQRRKSTVLLKKQVKFTDDMKCCADVITTILPETHTRNGNAKMFIIDTLPEYSENILSWHEQSKTNPEQQEI